MGREQILISGIEHKVRKLFEQNRFLKNENSELHQHINTLKNELEVLTIELEKKRNELLKISLAKTLEAEYGVEESRTKIDDLIKEIDRCIEVLSD